MRLYKTKKSSIAVTELGFWIFFAMAIGGMTFFILWACGVNIGEAARIPLNVEDEIAIAPRFYDSEKCFAYVDEVDNVHAKLIDVSKFNKANLDANCFPEGYTKYSFKLILEQDFEGVGPKLSFGPIKTYNWADAGYESKQIAEKVSFLYFGSIYNGKLTISVKDAN